MHPTVADFTEAERELVADILQQRYLKPVVPELADSELKLDPSSESLTTFPTLYWRQRGASFVVCKVADGRYRCQFFYADADHYGTGQDEYTDLGHCILTLLHVQADHEAQSAGISSGTTVAKEAAGNGEGENEYHGPVVI